MLACRSAHFRKLLQDASPSDGAPTVLQMPEVTHAALTAVVAYLVTDELGVTAPGDGGGSAQQQYHRSQYPTEYQEAHGLLSAHWLANGPGVGTMGPAARARARARAR